MPLLEKQCQYLRESVVLQTSVLAAFHHDLQERHLRAAQRGFKRPAEGGPAKFRLNDWLHGPANRTSSA
jgi:hypothetical protein